MAICSCIISILCRKNISNLFSGSRAMLFLVTFFDPRQTVFRSFFDHLFSRQMKTAELSPAKISTEMHTTSTHLSAFVEPNNISGGPCNSLLCTKTSTRKSPKTHYGAVTTPTDLPRLHGISSSTLRHLPKPSGPGF